MAFLDNSGDIILDAVLTETGRRRMAEGNFTITKFALGDDEIDYSLYNKNHPSGSAYYDLEILQTPVFEAFTQVNAGINYGLLATTALDLLYLPVVKINELAAVRSEGAPAIASSGSSGLFFVADNSNDSTSTVGEYLTNSGSIGFINGNDPLSNFVLLESGMDTGVGSVPNGTQANQTNYIRNNSLLDEEILVSFDNRFFSTVKGTEPTTEFAYDRTFRSTLQLGIEGATTTISTGLENYSSVLLPTSLNQVYYSSAGTLDNNYSVIAGPRGFVVGIAPVLNPALDAEYIIYGSPTSEYGTGMYFVDTTIYVQGLTTQATAQIPIRIIKLA